MILYIYIYMIYIYIYMFIYSYSSSHYFKHMIILYDWHGCESLPGARYFEQRHREQLLKAKTGEELVGFSVNNHGQWLLNQLVDTYPSEK